MKRGTKIVLWVGGGVLVTGVVVTIIAVVTAPRQQGPEGAAMTRNPIEALGRMFGIAANAAQNFRNDRDGGGAYVPADAGLEDMGVARGGGREGMTQQAI
jgi:hypothetical protein